MAKAVVTQNLIFTEADAIVAAVNEPSILAVQARIGGGRYSTVSASSISGKQSGPQRSLNR